MQRFRGILALSACLGLMQVPTAMAAEFIGLNLRPAQLAPAYNGYSGGSSMDLVDDLDAESPGQSSMLLILEHRISALPNLKYQGLALESPRGSQPVAAANLPKSPA